MAIDQAGSLSIRLFELSFSTINSMNIGSSHGTIFVGFCRSSFVGWVYSSTALPSNKDGGRVHPPYTVENSESASGKANYFSPPKSKMLFPCDSEDDESLGAVTRSVDNSVERLETFAAVTCDRTSCFPACANR